MKKILLLFVGMLLIPFLSISQSKLTKGDTFKSFTLPNKEGNDIKVECNQGKYLLLDFTATGCSPCLRSIPELREVNDTYSDQLDIISIWHDRNKEVWLTKKLEEKSLINWLDLWDEKLEVFNSYGVKFFPTYILIDPKGVILKRWDAYPRKGAILKKVEKHLKNT